MDSPRYIRLHATDNVAIVANARGLPAGSVFPDGLTLRERVPLGHKLALVDIAAGTIATGAATIEQTGQALFERILDTASGRNIPWADRWGIANTLALFNPAPVT